MSLLQRGLMFVLAAGTLVLPSTNPPETRAGGRAAAPVETEAKAASPAAEKTAAPAKRGAKKKAVNVSPEQRHNYVQIAAYYVAERHGFTSGREAADWAEGEAEIDRLLAGGHFNP